MRSSISDRVSGCISDCVSDCVNDCVNDRVNDRVAKRMIVCRLPVSTFGTGIETPDFFARRSIRPLSRTEWPLEWPLETRVRPGVLGASTPELRGVAPPFLPLFPRRLSPLIAANVRRRVRSPELVPADSALRGPSLRRTGCGFQRSALRPQAARLAVNTESLSRFLIRLLFLYIYIRSTPRFPLALSHGKQRRASNHTKQALPQEQLAHDLHNAGRLRWRRHSGMRRCHFLTSL